MRHDLGAVCQFLVITTFLLLRFFFTFGLKLDSSEVETMIDDKVNASLRDRRQDIEKISGNS